MKIAEHPQLIEQYIASVDKHANLARLIREPNPWVHTPVPIHRVDYAIESNLARHYGINEDKPVASALTLIEQAHDIENSHDDWKIYTNSDNNNFIATKDNQHIVSGELTSLDDARALVSDANKYALSPTLSWLKEYSGQAEPSGCLHTGGTIGCFVPMTIMAICASVGIPIMEKSPVAGAAIATLPLEIMAAIGAKNYASYKMDLRRTNQIQQRNPSITDLKAGAQSINHLLLDKYTAERESAFARAIGFEEDDFNTLYDTIIRNKFALSEAKHTSEYTNFYLERELHHIFGKDRWNESVTEEKEFLLSTCDTLGIQLPELRDEDKEHIDLVVKRLAEIDEESESEK